MGAQIDHLESKSLLAQDDEDLELSREGLGEFNDGDDDGDDVLLRDDEEQDEDGGGDRRLSGDPRKWVKIRENLVEV